LLNPVAGDGAALALRVTLLANNRDHNGETWEDGFQPTLSTTDDMLRASRMAKRSTLSIRAPGDEIVVRHE
jgi:hypothetical protein